MSDDHLIRRLRAEDPAADIDPNPHSSTGRRLLDQARRRGEKATAMPRRPARRRVVITAIAGLVALSGAGALASGVFDPEPEEVTAVLDDAQPRESAHLEDWRPELTSETVWCIYEDGGGTRTVASEFPLERPLTAENLIEECTSDNDQVRSGESAPPTSTTLCGGVLPDDEITRRLEFTDDQILVGSISDARYHFPVVVGWDTDCRDVDLSGAPAADLQTLDSLDAMNRARELEVGLKAAAIEQCLSREQVVEMAEQVREELHDDWLIIDHMIDDADCYQADLQPEEGWITIGRAGTDVITD